MNRQMAINVDEIWKDIKGYEGYYRVSNHGQVISLPRVIHTKNGREHFINGRVRSATITRGGRYHLSLCKHGIKKYYYVHRLVAEAFIDGKEPDLEVNHMDGDYTNNIASNLEWVTKIENMDHAFANNLNPFIPIPVDQFKNGEFINRFPSLISAGRDVNGCPTNIKDVCEGKYKMCKGYEWKFANKGA